MRTSSHLGQARQVMARLGRHERGFLLALVVATAALWGFFELADEVHEGETRRIDELVLVSLREPDALDEPRGPDWLVSVARDVTALGGVVVLGLATLAVLGYLRLSHRYRAMWLVLGATLTGVLLNLLLKHLFMRPRPDVVPHLAEVSTSSFPSGHSMLSAIVWLTFGALLARVQENVRLKAYVLCLSAFIAVLVGLSRVFLGVHYPSDVAAGWAVGAAWAVVCWAVMRLLQRRGIVERA